MAETRWWRRQSHGSLAGPTLGDLEDAVHLHTLQDIGATTDPADLDTIDPCPLAQAEMWIHPVMALVPAATVDLIDLGQVTGDHLDSCADAVPVAPGSAQPDLNPVVLAGAVV